MMDSNALKGYGDNLKANLAFAISETVWYTDFTLLTENMA